MADGIVRRLIVATALVVVGGLIAAFALVVSPWLGVPARFWFAPIEAVSIDGRDLRVVRVDYGQGLREVESLGDLDGALFVRSRVAGTDEGMGMEGARMSLDVVFFDADGVFIDRYTMPVCEVEACEDFYPGRPWKYAIEAPAGSLVWISASALLTR
jgi:uncharacterized membrane protein (UPF0127 family)